MKKFLFIFGWVIFWMSAGVPLQANIQNTIEEKMHSSQKAHRHKLALVELEFRFIKEMYYERNVRFHPGEKIKILTDVQHQTRRCRGVLLDDLTWVLTPATCVAEKSGFELKKVKLALANGKKGCGSKTTVQVSGEISRVRVASELVSGLVGVPAASISPTKTLREVYGSDLSLQLMDFLITGGVFSPRAARWSPNPQKPRLQVGDPFFYQGKLVALVRRVPVKIPWDLFSGVNEDFLSVLRTP